MEQDIYIRKLSEEFGISEYAIAGEIRADSGKQAARVPQYRNRREHSQGSSTEIRMDFTFLVLAMANRYYVKRMEADGVRFRTAVGSRIFQAVKNLAGEEYPPGVMGVDMQRVYNALDPEDEVLLRNAVKNIRLGPDDEIFYNECLASYQMIYFRERRAELQNELATAQKMGNEEDMTRIAKELMELDAQMQSRKMRGN